MKKDRIKQRRKELGLTQGEVGKAVGVSKVTVSQWESGDTSPKGSNLLKLAKALKIDADWIESGKAINTGKSSNLYYEEDLDSGIPLLDRNSLKAHLEGASVEVLEQLESLIINPKDHSNRVFALKEDMSGLEPMINNGDYVYINPDLPMKADTNSMFWVGDTPLIGRTLKSPAGITLTFNSQAPGWEPVTVDESSYIGRVIAVDPKWARDQRGT